MKKGILKAVFRGVVKSFPLGNVIIETVNNFKAKPLINIEPREQADVIKQIEKPHNWVSISTQLIIIGAIVYAFATKQIDLNQLIDILK